MKIVDYISKLINDHNGIFTFCLHSELDNHIYDEISNRVLNKVNLKNRNGNVSYIKSLTIKDSIFEFNSNDIFNQSNSFINTFGQIDYAQNKTIIETLSENCRMNNNVVLLKSKYSMNTNNINAMHYSLCVFEIVDGKMSLIKSRFAREYKDIDMISYIRDIKINEILD